MILTNFLAFMFHDPLYAQEDSIEQLTKTKNDRLTPQMVLELLQQYTIGKYVIAVEESPYRHFHVCIEMSPNDYNAFVQKTLRKQFGLRGRAANGLPRQYGRVIGIKKPHKMITYTLKQGCYLSNIPESELEPYKKASYTKDTQQDRDKEIREKLRDYLENVHYKDHFKYVPDEHLQKAILRFLLKDKIRIRTRSMIDGYLIYIRQFSTHDYLRRSDAEYYFDRLFII